MAEVLVAPDSEAAAVVWLRAGLGALAGRVSTAVPATMPATMVRVSLTGGGRAGVAASVAQLTVDCWADDQQAASNLARNAEAVMLAAAGVVAGGVFVRRVDSLGSVQSLPDPDTNKPHHLFTVRWHVRPATI